MHGRDGPALLQIEARSTHHLGQHDHRLLQRKGRADAHPRAGPERQIGEAVDPSPALGQETARIEGVGLLPQGVMPVQHPGRDCHDRALWDAEPGDPILPDCRPAHEGHRRIEPHGLLDHGPREDQPVEIGGLHLGTGENRIDLGFDPRPHLGGLRQQVERPGQGVGGRLVAGANKSNDVGLHLDVTEPLASLWVGRLQ
jgi:hypothetical protein